jgi:hypothetical protein
MPKKLVLMLATFAIAGVLVFVIGWASNSQSVALPQRITEETPCPVAGCLQPDGACHTASAPPAPDGSFAMTCPRIEGCSDVQCHAWDRIEATRSKPSDASMNLWILAPVVFVLGLVIIVRKL